MKLDICLVIDSTGSMAHVLNMVKDKALSLSKDIIEDARRSQKPIDKMRVKVIAFRDFYSNIVRYDDVIKESRFFDLPREEKDLKNFVDQLQPGGGEHFRVRTSFADLEGLGSINLEDSGRSEDPESGLEALNLAINSRWDTSAQGYRQLIVLWTDATAHPLSVGQIPSHYFTEDTIINTVERNEGATSTTYVLHNIDGAPEEKPHFYPKGMCGSLSELTTIWGQNMGASSKRLILFTPNVFPWEHISDDWDNVIHWSGSHEDGLTSSDYRLILQTIINSI